MVVPPIVLKNRQINRIVFCAIDVRGGGGGRVSRGMLVHGHVPNIAMCLSVI